MTREGAGCGGLIHPKLLYISSQLFRPLLGDEQEALDRIERTRIYASMKPLIPGQFVLFVITQTDGKPAIPPPFPTQKKRPLVPVYKRKPPTRIPRATVLPNAVEKRTVKPVLAASCVQYGIEGSDRLIVPVKKVVEAVRPMNGSEVQQWDSLKARLTVRAWVDQGLAAHHPYSVVADFVDLSEGCTQKLARRSRIGRYRSNRNYERQGPVKEMGRQLMAA